MKTAVIISVNLLFYINGVYVKPLPEIGLIKDKRNSPEGRLPVSDVHNSIVGEINSANPDMESFADQEKSMYFQRDISPLNLQDHMNNFQSQKSLENEQNVQVKTAGNNQPTNMFNTKESVENNILTADEQEECYKQQNIDPPGALENVGGKWSKIEGSQGMLIKDTDQYSQPSFVRSEIIKERGGKHSNQKDNERLEINSLYSNSEKGDKVTKVKQLSQPRFSDAFNAPKRVYKPIGVEAQFPVYDEDIAIIPDPLQGILDDKYWLDSEYQASVIKKYIDLAVNNMIPLEMEVIKRNVGNSDSKTNIIKSKAEFKDVVANGKSYNKEIVSCGECSKGKSQKTGNTTKNQKDLSYGRKLLSIDYNENEPLRKRNNNSFSYVKNNGTSRQDVDDEKIQFDKYYSSFINNYFGRKLLSFEDTIDEDEDKTMKENNILQFRNAGNLHSSRNLLSSEEDEYSNYGNKNEKQEDFMKMNPEADVNIPKFEDNKMYSNMEDKANPPFQSIHDNNEHHVEHFRKVKSGGYTLPMESHIVDIRPKLSEYYTSNKLANFMQNPLQKKNKYPNKPTSTSPPHYLQTLRNLTSENMRLEHTVKASNQNKIHNKRGYGILPFFPKGRKSYVEFPFAKNPHEDLLNQHQKEDTEYIYREMNKTGVVSQNLSNYTVQSNPSVNVTTAPSYSSTFQSNATVFSASLAYENIIKTQEDDDDVDVEVANKIVESIISESQNNPMLSHNLGLCRNNESTMNAKYKTIVPDTEKVLKAVSDCIMKKLQKHLDKQSCVILDLELLEFLKWLVLTGESYKDYMIVQREFKPPTGSHVTCTSPITSPTTSLTTHPTTCKQEPPQQTPPPLP